MRSSDQPRPTPVDYVAEAVSPGLIVVMVCSLVFFLLDLFYLGRYTFALQWTLFFFVFGAVLIARISMMGGISTRASLYGVVLGIAVWIAMQTFVTYPEDSPALALRGLINLGLIAIVWWCAHKLTKDCTNLDEKAEMSGTGILQAVGFDPEEKGEESSDDEPNDEEPAPRAGKKPAKKADDFWSRYRRYADKRRKKHTLGVWVVYFSLAALPLFGLGQALIPSEELERRRYSFWLLTIYVASGLGLLLTTCFLSLRRYLRQKKLEMPAAMTRTWLLVGGIMIALMLLAGAMLPRPWPEYSFIDFRPLGDGDQKSSRFAMKQDSPAKDEGPGAKDKGKDEPADKAPGGPQKDKNPGKDKDKAGSGDKNGKDRGSKQDKKDGKGGDKDKDKDNGEKKKDGDKKADSQDSSEPKSSSWQALEWLKPFMKWLVFLVLAGVVAFVLFRSGLGWLANFSEWAKNLLAAWNAFWARLFGGKQEEQSEQEDAELRRAAARPFSAFDDPFASGEAARWSARELTRYTFAAVEAWARERDLARHDGETPYEFCMRVGNERPALEADLQRLAALFARAAYALGAMPKATAESLRPLWERLTA